MQYIDPLLFSALLLVSTPTTGFLSWLFGIEGVPDKYTIIGGSILLTGIGLITYSEHKRHQATTTENKEIEIKSSIQDHSKNNIPNSPLSITSLIQLTPTPSSKYNKLQQDEEDNNNEVDDDDINQIENDEEQHSS